jgi:PAS domain S-box-containing protein
MVGKPTYEELEKRIQELESEHRESEEALQEKRYESLFKYNHSVMLIIDPENANVVDANPAAISYYGWSYEEITKKKITDINILTKDKIFQEMERAKKEQRQYFFFRHCLSNGEIRDVEVYTGPITIFGKKHLYSIVHDITERKRAEKALRESEEKYRSMMEAMKDQVYICSPDYRVEYTNPAMAKRIGHDAIGEYCFKALHNLEEKCSWCVHDMIQQGKCFETDISSPKNNRFYHVSHSPIIHEDGSISKMTVYSDTTAFKKMETHLQQAQKMESIGTLAGGIAHDFNNILFPVVGHTEMLLEDVPESSPLRESLQDIYTSAMRAKDLVKQILTFSRQENSELKLMKMQPIVKEALKLIRSTIPATIKIKQDIHRDCGVIKADPTQIHQIVMNLSTNAYHAMEDIGGELKITLKEREFGEFDLIDPEMMPEVYACLIVADTGKGMDKELTQKIFDPFFTTKAKGKGTGMGLSVVHGIVKGMNGAIKVYSELGKGAEFHVYLPVVKSSFKEQVSHSKSEIEGGKEHILLVDDEESILAMGKKMLERLGYQVTSRISSIEALEAFRATPYKFDLIITDMTMPNMTGDKLSTEVTNIRNDIPVLLCTGFSETMSEEKAVSLGIKGFLMKPILMKELSQKIREVLNKNKSKNAS